MQTAQSGEQKTSGGTAPGSTPAPLRRKGFFNGPWLLLAGVLLVTVAAGALLWVKVVRPWLQVEALNEKGIHVPPQEDPGFEISLAEAVQVFDSRKFHEARQLLLDLAKSARTDQMRTAIEGLVTATYDGAGEPREGIDYLCEIYKNRPGDDVRYRFGFQAHLRAIAEEEGLEAAKVLITGLHPKCPRRDLSYVWPGIRREKAEFLAKGHTLYEDDFRLSERDRRYLRGVIRQHPEDAFIDHAFYFLEEFDRVIDDYPDSLIADVVYRAAGHQALKKRDYDQAILLLKTAARRWPHAPGMDRVRQLLAEAYYEKGDLRAAIGWLLRIQSGSGPKLAEMLGQETPFTDSQEVQSFLDALSGAYPAEKIGDLFATDCQEHFALAEDFLWSLDYRQALAEYEGVKSVFQKHRVEVPKCIERGIEVLSQIVDASRDAKEEQLKLGFYLRDEAAKEIGPAFAAAAAVVWEQCAERFPGTEEAERSLYLAGALNRRREAYAEAMKLFRKLADDYPKSELADDALTEVGWYYLFPEPDYRLARRYFDRVVRQYPKANAADNAMNWMARSYYRERDYLKAYQTYNRLVAEYPRGRLAELARREAESLKAVAESRRQRNTVRGLLSLMAFPDPRGVWVIDIEQGSDAARAGLRESDVIVAVNGESVDAPGTFYDVLSVLEPGFKITLTVRRKTTVRTLPNVPVGREWYYTRFP